jgi:hypothetical protein
MGRLPATWADRVITMRVPYNMPGEIILASGQTGKQFPLATFSNNVDKPFETHRYKPFVTALDASGNAVDPQPDQDLLQGLVRVRIFDEGKNQDLTKNPSLMHLLTKGSSERTWEFADPYYMVRSENYQVTCDVLVFPAAWATLTIPITQIRVESDFQGFLLVVAPPSNTR